MSRHLSELLGASEPTFAIILRQLETATGNSGTDVRLTADIISRTHQKSRALGLDPKDTTAKELYQALLALARLHDQFLAAKIGGSDAADVADMLPRIRRAALDLDLPTAVWVLKTSVAKRMLKATPPKKVMKYLGYRSLDSMLKREAVGQLYAGLRLLESADWQQQFLKKYQKLRPSDFESRPLDIIILDSHKWGRAAAASVGHNRHNLLALKELGLVCLLPLPFRRLPGLTLATLPLLIHYINELRTINSFFKLQQVRSDFGDIVAVSLIDDPAHHAVMAGQPVHWRIIHSHFGQNKPARHPDIFEPHVQPEDLAWRKAEDVIYRLEPALHFWHDGDYVASPADDRPVSFNLLDMAVNAMNNLSFEQRSSQRFRDSLRHEIHRRYLAHASLQHQVLGQLESRLAGNE